MRYFSEMKVYKSCLSENLKAVSSNRMKNHGITYVRHIGSGMSTGLSGPE